VKLRDLREGLYIENLDRAPTTFKQAINTLVTRDSELFVDEDPRSSSDVVISFGNSNLPTSRNRIHIGGKFHNKESQYQLLRDIVPTIKTYTDSLEVAGERFIAKKKAGYKQQGQLIDELPDDDSDYVFQPLVDIMEEYRVITYFMNGDYHVAGIYKKSGSNVSYKSININSPAGRKISDMAMNATEALGYGFSGADVAIVSNRNKESLNVNESVTGFIASKTMRAFGSLDNTESLLRDNYLVVIEVNSMPSMANVGIYFDLKTSIKHTAHK
jgi:hypothetical protein